MTDRAGYPIHLDTLDVGALPAPEPAGEPLLGPVLDGRRCGVIVRGAFPAPLCARAIEQLGDPQNAHRWASPNAGMRGGEIRVIGDAATPTFTALRGPSPERYADNAERHPEHVAAIFGDAGDPVEAVSSLLSRLFGGRPAAPARLDSDRTWAPFSLRALDPGEQIYSHHDNHYGLEVYKALAPDLDREVLLSWFITLQTPESGGALIIYGLRGDDPNVPYLPTRFIDTAALERDFIRHPCDLNAGDLIVFNAGHHVHRVTPVEGPRPRLTLGGFLTVARDRSRLAYWS